MNPQETTQNAGQPELVLDMSHFQRDQLITSLIKFDTVLQLNKPTLTVQNKRTMSRQIVESISFLLELTPIALAQSTNRSVVLEGILNGHLIIGLAREERSRVVNHLIALKDAVMSDQLASAELKIRLAIENRKIINQLLNLPCREGSGLFCEPRPAQNSSNKPSAKKQESRRKMI